MSENSQQYTYRKLSQEDVRRVVHVESVDEHRKLQENGFFMDYTKFKYLTLNIIQGNNLMMVGPAGCGKTQSVYHVSKILNRPFFTFNLGAAQDARITLIGTSHLGKDGTYFSDSLFVTAIQTPGAVILLDEFSRVSTDGSNILMSVLDPNQRYLRIDEASGSRTVRVADGVSFVATANIGNEYTGTRRIDKAMKDRFAIIEMQPPSMEVEKKILLANYNISEKHAEALARLSRDIRIQYEAPASDEPIGNYISTRSLLRCAQLVEAGFKMKEVIEVAVRPLFSDEGDHSDRKRVGAIAEKLDLSFDEKPVANAFTSDDLAKKKQGVADAMGKFKNGKTGAATAMADALATAGAIDELVDATS